MSRESILINLQNRDVIFNKMNNKKLRLLSVVFILNYALSAFAGNNLKNESMKLVSIAKIDQIVLLASVRGMFPNGGEGEPSYQAFLGCMLRADKKNIANIYSEKISNDLSRKEILNLIDFYTSPIGKKHVEMNMQDIYNLIGFAEKGKVPEFSPEEKKNFENFYNSHMGMKMRNMKISDDNMRKIVFESHEIMSNCAKSTVSESSKK